MGPEVVADEAEDSDPDVSLRIRRDAVFSSSNREMARFGVILVYVPLCVCDYVFACAFVYKRACVRVSVRV